MIVRILVGAAAWAALAGMARADTTDAGVSDRTLGGHPFLPMNIVAEPFVGSQYGSATALGTAGLRFDQADLDRSHLSESDLTSSKQHLDLVFYNGTILVQQGIAGILALRGSLGGTLLTGSNSDTGFIFGALGTPSYSLGAAGKIVRAGPFQLGASVDFSENFGFQVSPNNILNQTLEQGQIPRNILIHTTDTSLQPALSAAVAVHRTLGLVASGAIAFDNSSGDGQASTSSTAGTIAGGISFNLEPEGIPVGALVAISHTFPHGAVAQESTTIEGGIFPVSFSHFALGLEVQYAQSRIGQVDVTDQQGSVVDHVGENLNITAFQVAMLYAR